VLKDVAMTKRGLVIFVGGTGTGKTTSLAAMVDFRNEHSYGHIITVEDPIEYVHQHKNCIVTQRELGIDTDSWEIALKNTLRQAPDVILMGEIRDRETMDYAIAFAETGHLCLATLHANSTNQALDRIINFFPEERRQQLLMDLSLNIRAMISQRLMPLKDRGLGVMGFPDGRTPGRRRPRRHRLQPHRRQGRRLGGRAWRARPRRRRGRRPATRRSCSPASATTTTCAASCSARTAPSPA
jgi:pilus retraction protein PilT